MTADLLALIESDPAAGIFAVAELRERRARSVPAGEWYVSYDGGQYENTGEWWSEVGVQMPGSPGPIQLGDDEEATAQAEHIAAEANPAHALAAVRRWRGVVERHRVEWHEDERGEKHDRHTCSGCWQRNEWTDEFEPADGPCVELTETADEARAYLGGTQ